MQVGISSMHLNSSPSSTTAKCTRYTAAGLKSWSVILILRCNLFQMTLILKLLMIYQKILITAFQQISED